MNSESPKGWLLSSLGDVCRFTMGQSPSSETYNGDGEGLPFFQGKADFGSRHPKIRSWCTKPVKVANENAILFSVRAPVGEVNVTPFKACVGRGLAAIEAESADQEFIYQKLQHLKPDFALLSQGSTFEAVNGNQLRQFPIALPPRQEQQKIATILSSVDDVIEKTRAQIDKLKDLKTGMMQELLTQGIGHTEFKDSPVGQVPWDWQVSKLDYFVDFISYGFTNPMPESLDGPFMVTAKDVANLEIMYSGARKTTWEAYQKRLTAKSRPKIDDILLTKDGTLGRVALVDREDVCINQSVAVLRPNERIIPRFLLYLLDSPGYQREMRDKSGGSTIKHLYITVIDKMLVAVPPIEEQRYIVEGLDALMGKLSLRERKLNQLNDCKKALMQDLLTGKVRVNVDQEESEVA